MPRAADLPSYHHRTQRSAVADAPARHPPGRRRRHRAGARRRRSTPSSMRCADFGVRHIEMPATPERVWRAIQEARSGQANGRRRAGGHARGPRFSQNPADQVVGGRRRGPHPAGAQQIAPPLPECADRLAGDAGDRRIAAPPPCPQQCHRFRARHQRPALGLVRADELRAARREGPACRLRPRHRPALPIAQRVPGLCQRQRRCASASTRNARRSGRIRAK